MELTNTGEYAIRAMIHLSIQSSGVIVPILDISKTAEVPENFLRKILGRLSRAGLIRSFRGVGGGVGLARPADQITMLDIIEAVEGKIFLNKCLFGSGSCHRMSWCAVHDVWGEAQNKVREVLTGKSLADLARLSASKAESLGIRIKEVRVRKVNVSL